MSLTLVRILFMSSMLGKGNRSIFAHKRNTTEGGGTQRVEYPNTTKTSVKSKLWMAENVRSEKQIDG